MSTKHTPTPWEVFVSNNKGNAIQIAVPIDAKEDAGEHIATVMGGASRKANAERIVACVNACEGLNPEALSLLVDVTTMIANYRYKMPNQDEWNAVRNFANRAITKATEAKS